jgi:hypothetical protein
LALAPHKAFAAPIIITANENADETLADNRPAGIDQVPLGDYKSTGETNDADTFSVAIVDGLKTIVNFHSDSNTDNSPADVDEVVIGDAFNPSIIIRIRAPKEGIGAPDPEPIPEPAPLTLIGLGLVLLTRMRLRRRDET